MNSNLCFLNTWLSCANKIRASMDMERKQVVKHVAIKRVGPDIGIWITALEHQILKSL